VANLAKWKSPLFSDIRNKLGENVVFSMWKGRPYMREYVIPANPQTDAQTANRLHMAAIVLLYQTNIKGTAVNKAAWNVEALPKVISGYNIFTEYGRQGLIAITSLVAATLDIELVSSGIPADRLSLMSCSAADVPIEISTKRSLGHYVPGDWVTPPVATDKIYVVDTKVLVSPDIETTPKLYKAVNHWFPNETTGLLEPFVIT
jgi:hypothetical protein